MSDGLNPPSGFPRHFARFLALTGIVLSVPACCGVFSSSLMMMLWAKEGEPPAALLAYACLAFIVWGLAQLLFYLKRSVDDKRGARLWWLSTAIYNGMLASGSLAVVIDELRRLPNGYGLESPLAMLMPALFAAISVAALVARRKET